MHTMTDKVTWPDGDVLIVAGDLTFSGTEMETLHELFKISKLPHQHKIVIAGNHDFYFDKNSPERFRNWDLKRTVNSQEILSLFPGITYLQDESVTIGGLNFYGSPWTVPFCDWAFNLAGKGLGQTGYLQIYEESEKHPHPSELWAKIPMNTDVLITHGPPYAFLDKANGVNGDNRQGDLDLAERLLDLPFLRLHIFGHIHEQYGKTEHDFGNGPVTLANVAVNTRDYQPTNAPMVFDL